MKEWISLKTAGLGLALTVCDLPWPMVAAAETVPSVAQIDQALWCVADAHIVRQPGVGDQTVLLLPGTNNTGPGVWAWSYGAQLPADGFRACTLDFPHRNTEDLQISGRYVAGALARLRQRYPQTQLSVIAHSLGNLSALWAFHYRSDFMARNVSAYVAIGAPFKGVPAAVAENCSTTAPCQPYQWQVRPGSEFLAAVNATPLPAPVRYASLVSVNDPLYGDQWRDYTAFPAGTQALQIGVQQLCASDQIVAIYHVQELAVESIYRLTRDIILNRPWSDLGNSACTTQAYPQLEAAGLQWTNEDGGHASHLGDAPEVGREPPLNSRVQ